MNNRVTLALSLLVRVFAVAAIGVAYVRVLDHAIPSFVLRGDATAIVTGYVKLLGHASLDLAALSRDVLTFFGAN
jgi:mannose/fructose/N-acetylgalactosamine-specific phosphotransferase system component IIC